MEAQPIADVCCPKSGLFRSRFLLESIHQNGMPRIWMDGKRHGNWSSMSQVLLKARRCIRGLLEQEITWVVDWHTDTGKGDGNALENSANNNHGNVLRCCQDYCCNHEGNTRVHHDCSKSTRQGSELIWEMFTQPCHVLSCDKQKMQAASGTRAFYKQQGGIPLFLPWYLLKYAAQNTKLWVWVWSPTMSHCLAGNFGAEFGAECPSFRPHMTPCTFANQ